MLNGAIGWLMGVGWGLGAAGTATHVAWTGPFMLVIFGWPLILLREAILRRRMK